MKKLSYILLFIVFIFTSCTITQEFHFNKDFSGSAKITIDMGTLIDMMAGMDSTGTQSANLKDSLDFAFKESSEKLKGLGVTNVNYGWLDNDKTTYLSYNFPDIETLNKAMNASDDGNTSFMKSEDNDEHVYFKRKRKTLIYESVKSKKDSVNSKEMASMKDYYKYKLIFTFDRKIKKVDNKNIILSEKNKKATLNASLIDVIKHDYNSIIKFKLK
ncbi:MAG: hypothetical protein B6I20_07105 [Bacteroidetes bacterium 4572_117]|nr:MAG: hypothetical protein B6I20_07105 [Bacteroidetes bacterium 4572_117]